jgi:hypothetical protein
VCVCVCVVLCCVVDMWYCGGQDVEGEVVRLYARVCCSGLYAVAEESLKKQKKDRIVFDRCGSLVLRMVLRMVLHMTLFLTQCFVLVEWQPVWHVPSARVNM